MRISGFKPGFKVTSLWVLLIAVLICYSPTRLLGQAAAAINGTVKDESGAVIAGAQVVLLNTETGVKTNTVTNGSGIYVFVHVLPGTYSITASRTGFRSSVENNVVLVVNEATTYDFTLAVGSSTQTVTVSAAAEALQTSSASLGTVVRRKEVNDLPLNGRNFTQILSLTPGVSPVSTAQNKGGAQASPLGSFVFPAVNGQSNRSNFFTLDGIDDTDQTFDTYALAPILDDIEEFKVQSHNDVEFGGVLGGIVNVVTKSGTNHFHGTLWEFVRNDNLNALSPFAVGFTPFTENDFGGNLGGPVLLPHYNGHNKTFFFASYEGYRISLVNNARFYLVPTPAELSGDLSDINFQLYNPYTTRPDPNNPGKVIRDPFPNNQIPSNLINPGAVAFAKAVFPAPVSLPNGFNGINTQPTITHQNEYSIRIDHTFNASNTIFFRYTHSDQPITGPGSFAGLDAFTDTPAINYALSYLHTFNPTTILHLEFGHVSLTHNTSTAFPNLSAQTVNGAASFVDSFGCGFPGAPAGCLIPDISIPGFLSGGEGVSNTKLTNIYQYRGDITKILGVHTLSAGFNIQTDNFTVNHTSAGVGFSSSQTADPELPGTGSPLASFLLGLPDNSNRTLYIAPVNGQKVLGFYFQDQWKATDRLTAELGIRYDLALWPTYGKRSNGTDAVGAIDFNNGTYIMQRSVPACGNGVVAPCIPGGTLPDHVVVSPNGHLWQNTYDNWQPRVGLSYRLTSKTALHASFGMFNDEWAGVTQSVQNMGGDWPNIGKISVVDQNPLIATPNVTMENPLSQSGNASLPATNPFSQVEYYRDPNANNPYSEQWMTGVQQMLGQSTVLTVDYVGAHTLRLTVGGFYNVAVTPGPGNPQLREPFPYIKPTHYDRSVGNSNYNAFQFSLNHQASQGLAYLLSYTWSKTIDVGCDGFFGVEGCSVQNPYNLQPDRSVAGFDLPQVLSVSVVYQLPFGNGQRFDAHQKLANWLIGGWQTNGILTLTSGQPYTITATGDIANTGNTNYERANIIGNPKPQHQTTAEWFNTAAFAAPALYTFGDSGRNAFRGDWYKDLDLSLFRSFPITENKRIEFRAEAFNLTNTPTWGTPVNSINNPNFGRVLTTRSTARQLQLAVKFYF